MIRSAALTLLLPVLLVPVVVHAQDAYYEVAAQHSQAPVYHEAVAVPGAGGTTLVIAFRIPNSRLVFVRNRAETPGRLFVSGADVTVQLYRGQERVDETVWRREHFAATFEQTLSKEHDLTGAVSFAVPPGRYGYRLILQDENTDELRPTWLEPVDVPAYGTLAVGAPVAARTWEAGTEGVEVHLANLGGALPYGAPASAVVPFTLPAGTDTAGVRLRYRLYRQDEARDREAERERRQALDRIRREQRQQPGRPPAMLDVPQAQKGDLVRAGDASTWVPVHGDPVLTNDRIQWPPGATATGYLASLDLDSERLADGAYVLEVTLEAGGQSTTRTSPLSTHWRNMPLSLFSAEAAIRNLSFIEERKTIREMLRGSREERERRIRQYWQERDPTPETAYNELMAEYYRRVDDAAVAFKTGRYPFPDGLETDQARIYIRHGPADHVERTFPPSGGVQEIWRYAGGQRFVFWAGSSLDPLELQGPVSQ